MSYRICSISGGGVRGIIPATIIEKMLEISKSNGGTGNISDICDYIVGTSVGGIIAGGLVATEDGLHPKFNAIQVKQLLENKSSIIFPEADSSTVGLISAGASLATFAIIKYAFAASALVSMGATLFTGGLMFGIGYLYNEGYFSPKYSRDGIDAVLEEAFGELKLSNTVMPLTIVSYSLDQQNPRVWSTLKATKAVNDDLFIKDALGATSAAPTYFPYKETTKPNGEKIYDIDGGIYANSPVNLAIAVLLKHADHETIRKIKNDHITVLSIGTGHESKSDFTAPSSFAQGKFGYGVINPLVFSVMNAAEKDSLIQANYVYRAIRLDPTLDPSLMPMDDSSQKHIEELSKAALLYIEQNQDKITEYTKCIFASKTYPYYDLCKGIEVENTSEYSYDTHPLNV